MSSAYEKESVQAAEAVPEIATVPARFAPSPGVEIPLKTGGTGLDGARSVTAGRVAVGVGVISCANTVCGITTPSINNDHTITRIIDCRRIRSRCVSSRCLSISNKPARLKR